MRILLTTDAVGGVWQYSLDLARALQELGFDAVLALMGPAATPEQRQVAQGVPLIEAGLPLDWLAEDEQTLLAAGAALARLARDEKADIVQLNSAALAAGGAFKLPVIAVQHSCVATWWNAVRGTELPPDFAWRAELTRRGLQAADAVVAPTLAFAEATQRTYQLSRTPHAVHNGRTPLNLSQAPQGDFVFTAGRLWDEGKDLRTLDAAAAMTRLPVRSAGLTRGPNGASVELTHLELMGNLDEPALAAELAQRPIFASAALYEPFGLAVLEAAQAGCALVLSDIPTFRELWDGAATFVPVGDAAAFAHAFDTLASDLAARDRAGSAAREHARKYTPAATAKAMAILYRSLAPLHLAEAAA